VAGLPAGSHQPGTLAWS